MEFELRLAERRGVFQRPTISRVAERCLALLVYADGIEDGRKYMERIRLGLLGNTEYEPKKLFPDAFKDDVKTVDAGTPEAEAAEATGLVEYDYSDVEWVSPNSDPEQYAELANLTSLLSTASNVSVEPGEDGWM